MIPRIFVAAMAVLASGCAATQTRSLHTTSQASFDPATKRVVWGRALLAFQKTGRLISHSDSIGGVLQSASQPTWTKCSQKWPVKGKCSSVASTQFTISDDGTAFLRINRGLLGQIDAFTGPLLSKDDEKAAQDEVDALVQFIVGTASEPPPMSLREDGNRI